MTDLECLNKLEDLSIEISDLINQNKFENVLELDLQRKKIIQSISASPDLNHKKKILLTISINKKLINDIENKITKLNTKHYNSEKRIKFYSLTK
tara:strand:+ start:593 stop:877 length:285 start_codon:yes stop_codon:yes gene_type:complete